MSKVRFGKDSYNSLPSIFIIQLNQDTGFNMKYLGKYDPMMGKEVDFTYEPGTLKENGKVLYDDTALEGKSCAYFYVKHRFFGNSYISRKTSKGHFHIKCIVSNNKINVWDCAEMSSTGDVFIFARLCENMPITVDDYTYSLYVIEPMLTQGEISALARNNDMVYQWKKKLMDAAEDVAEARGNEIMAMSMMTEADVKCSIYQNHVQKLSL